MSTPRPRRPFDIELSIRPSSEADRLETPYAGWASGHRMGRFADMTDDEIRAMVDTFTELWVDSILRARDAERQRDRELSKPFWKKWVGGV